jgi:hypothetical protein
VVGEYKLLSAECNNLKIEVARMRERKIRAEESMK